MRTTKLFYSIPLANLPFLSTVQTKNKLIDKTGDWQFVFEDLMPSSFVFQKGDEDWKAKRKAATHAFAKDKMNMMIEVMKDAMTQRIEKWMAEIEANP